MKKPFQTGNVLLVSSAHLLHDVYSSFFAPLLPLLIEKLGLSYFLVGTLSVVQRLPSLLNPFVGLIADRVSVRYFLILAPAITTVSMSLLGVAPSVVVLGILLFVMGIGSALFHVPGPVFVRHLSGSAVGRGMSFYMLGGELARTLGPLVILGAVSLWGLEGTFKLIPFGLLASFILYLRFHRIRVPKPNVDAAKLTLKIPASLLRFFMLILLFTFFRSIMKTAFTTFLPTYMKSQGASLWMSGASLSILQFSGAAGTFIAGPLSDKIGRKQTLLIIAIASPLLMWLFVQATGWMAIVILVIFGFFLFGNTPVILALVQEVSRDRPAFSNGVYMTISFVVSSGAALVIGFLSDRIGLHTSFEIAAFLALGGIPTVLLLPHEEKKLPGSED